MQHQLDVHQKSQNRLFSQVLSNDAGLKRVVQRVNQNTNSAQENARKMAQQGCPTFLEA